MDRPEATLLDLLQTEYAVTDSGIANTDIMWSLMDWSDKSKGAHAPYIVVKQAGATRDQPVELMFQFTFIIQVIWWPEHVDDLEARKADVWKVIEGLKAVIEDSANLPANWHNMRVDRLANVTVLNALPNVIIENVVVAAKIYWSA
jgi:hypothetical protein